MVALMIIKEPMATLDAINKKLEKGKEMPRFYLGISYAGHKCDRFLWLSFRLALAEKNNGRMIRLLNRGHREETEIVRLLKSVGVVIEETEENQRTVVLSPWIKGHPDGIIKSGLKESSKHEHIAEFKTSNDEAFKQIMKNGVAIAKPLHFAQMQLYMLGTGIPRAFYWCVNKDNDDVYTERVKLDLPFAEKLKNRAIAISIEPNLPEPLSTKPTWFECKLCKFWAVCHNHYPVEQHCRTCEYGKFQADGTFLCTLHNKIKADNKQLQPCADYKLHFDLETLCCK